MADARLPSEANELLGQMPKLAAQVVVNRCPDALTCSS